MSVSHRKMRPEPPRWFNKDTDNCWMCKKKHRGCPGCHFLKDYVKSDSIKRQKHFVKEIPY